ncbi:MAG TPA: hypothetical protein VJ436_08640 [Anaerolineales bacterium]|nr:hypothetical protein [Anaerolineales bacterium]
MAIDPANPATLYAGTYKGKVYQSNDGAATWQIANDGIQDNAIVYSIVIDPQNTQRVYAATRGNSNNGDRPWAGVVYRSEDAGATWIPSLYDLGGADYQDWVYALEINPNAPQIIFAATHEHGPVRSDDFGNTWKILENGIGMGRHFSAAGRSFRWAICFCWNRRGWSVSQLGWRPELDAQPDRPDCQLGHLPDCVTERSFQLLRQPEWG